MNLDGVLPRAEIAGDLLVELASNDMFEHFIFARSERREPGADPPFRPREPGHAILFKCSVHCRA